MKHGESLGMGLPIITNSGVGDMDLITDEKKNGICFDLKNLNVSEKLAVIHKLKSLDKSIIRETAFDFYDLKNGILAYLELYKQITTYEVH